MRHGRALAAVVAGVLLAAPPLAAQGAIQWHGYVQVRYGRTDPATGFSVRRAKLWMRGSVPGFDHLSFKVQGIFANGSSGAFVLQDAFAEYRGGVALRFGQFVPDFSLERSQPDYRVPLLERASVVETLIPGARTLGREIGAELLFEPGAGWLHLAAGLFGGNGANRPPGPEGDHLATGRVVLTRALGRDVRGSVGGSLAWRETHGADVGILSTTSGLFAGRDVRWGVEARVRGGTWNVQGEYLHARLEREISDGFYILGSMALGLRSEVSVSEERLEAVGDASCGGPWFVVGLTRYLRAASEGDAPQGKADAAYPAKIMTDLRVGSGVGRARVGAALQVQVFLR